MDELKHVYYRIRDFDTISGYERLRGDGEYTLTKIWSNGKNTTLTIEFNNKDTWIDFEFRDESLDLLIKDQLHFSAEAYTTIRSMFRHTGTFSKLKKDFETELGLLQTKDTEKNEREKQAAFFSNLETELTVLNEMAHHEQRL